VVIVATPNVSTTCGGVGAPVAVAGGSTVSLPAGRAIPGNGSCRVTVEVTAAVDGLYMNTLTAGALMTSHGSNAAPAVATLTVVPPLAASIPTLSEWAMILLVCLFVLFGVAGIRRDAM
jgi:Flp pilus assembly protein TadG